MNGRQRLLFYCQHSLGVGHLVRSLTLLECLASRFEVMLLSGGSIPSSLPVPPGIRVIPLPAIGMGEQSELISLDARYTPTTALVARRGLILQHAASFRPDVLVVELFPFGRKKFASELLPLLQDVRSRDGTRPLVACSLRDLLVRNRHDQQRHDDRVREILDRYFDAVLVHADPTIARLDETFRPSSPVAVPIHHTGFVGRDPPAVRDRRFLLVSAGSGRVGGPLLSAALEAYTHHGIGDMIPMKLVAGPFLPDNEWVDLCERARGVPGVEAVRSVPDLRVELAQAVASVSQAGYNTALEVLVTRTPALLVPFARRREDEQIRRARRLALMGAVRMLQPQKASAAALARGIRSLLTFRPATIHIDVRGAARSTEIIESLARAPHRLMPASECTP